jgi:hypothetical protein
MEGMGVYVTDVEIDVEEKELERGRRKMYVRGVINGNIWHKRLSERVLCFTNRHEVVKEACLTALIPTPVRTPNPRTSHQRKAPTRPAAPVPEAKYLSRHGVNLFHFYHSGIRRVRLKHSWTKGSTKGKSSIP